MSKSSQKEIFELLAKKLAGEATEEEKLLLEVMIESSESAKKTLTNAHHVWSTDYFSTASAELVSQKETSDQIWHKVFVEEKRNNRLHIFKRAIKIAASLIIFISAAFLALYFINQDQEVEPSLSTIQKQTLPGQKSSITLRDGTIVWLNSGSKISYQSNYNDSVRIINLEGQAYFEVFKDKSRPFKVFCRGLEVVALGTSFDVRGYGDTPIQVSLLTGSVELSFPEYLENGEKMILNPGEYSVAGNDHRFIEKGNFDPFEVLAWKEGRLIFDNATIEEIIPTLELWYGVDITNELNMNKNKPYTSTFEKENLDNILLNMGNILQFKYEIKGNDVTLKN